MLRSGPGWSPPVLGAPWALLRGLRAAPEALDRPSLPPGRRLTQLLLENWGWQEGAWQHEAVKQVGPPPGTLWGIDQCKVRLLPAAGPLLTHQGSWAELS